MTRKLAFAAVLFALVGAFPASGKVRDLYALRYGAEMNVLVPYDPVRLVPSGRSIRLGHFAHAWSVSPDRSRLVTAPSSWRATRGGPTALRFVDLTGGRIEGTLGLPGELRRVTANRQTAVSRAEVPGTVVLGERTSSSVVLLLAQPGSIGPATVAVVDQRPRVRTVVLDRITVGTTVSGTASERRTVARRPGLALAPSGRRVFVFGADEPTAVVDLRTLAVRYPPLRAVAGVEKQAQGSVRTAAPLPDGRIVVSGYDLGVAGPTSLQLVDPRDWTSRLLAPATSWFRVGGGLVFTRGLRGTGLRILKPSGTAIELFPGRPIADVFVVGPRALVTFSGTKQKAAVVVLGTGRVISQTVPAHPLIGDGQPIFVG